MKKTLKIILVLAIWFSVGMLLGLIFASVVNDPDTGVIRINGTRYIQVEAWTWVKVDSQGRDTARLGSADGVRYYVRGE